MEILASLDDINANLPSQEDPAGISSFVVEATESNTDLLQVSVARTVRGYLSGTIDTTTMAGWVDPTTTPDIVREAAAMFIAAQVYFNSASRSTTEVSDKSFAMRKIDAANDILNKIVSGEIVIGGGIITSDLTVDDFFPIDNTNRAFTLSMEL